VPVHADSFAPVFAYFQIGRDEAQIAMLHDEGFQVMPVPEIVATLHAGKGLPDKTVGLTFDDAYRSVAENALPVLRQARFPATIFVTPKLVDRGGDYMGWDDVRKAARDGFTIGAKIDLDDIDDDSSIKTLAAINDAMNRIHAEVGVAPVLFAYAEGIATRPMRAMVESRGFVAAFALQSGPATDTSDRFMLPRFPMTEAFGTIERFRIAASSLPLPVSDILPADQTIEGQNPPQIGFTVTSDDIDLGTLACFIEDQGRAPLEILDDRVEIRPASPFETDDETRVNCTAPASGANAGRWHWLGFNFYVPGGG
jgi:peptidoglycan/xylan/chitin deacetylase (PgdA/CDA1 family)